MSSDPWMFDEIEGPARVQRELAEQGWTLFHAPELLHRAEDPLGLSALLFGGLPLRYRSQELQADPVDPQRADYWRSKREAKLHTDGPACGLPPSAVVMMCRQPASDGGDVILLDTWPLLRAIEAEDPALFGQLFDVPHRFHFGDSDHWGPTFALRRGHLVVFHIGIADKSSETSRRFHARVDEAEKIHFRLRKRDVYIVNNHRCLHGRLAFEDLGRSIHRLMLWLLPPFAAPVDLVARASKGSDALAERLADQPPWVRRRFGV
ncbi:MAG: TauD/TfdA family dioxygenase, partial [Minicystis sp.]